MNTHDPWIIKTEGLSKRYNGVAALEDLRLTVPRHSIFGFLGPNGAGKSTTIKLLLGLTRPTAGSAAIFGRDSVRDSVAIRERTGYLAQDPRYYDYMTARETLEFTARFFYDGPQGVLAARIAETLDLVGLADKADRPIKGFSGGERQRLGIAQAQINQPDLLILDEPAAALDPMGRRDVLEVMERLRRHTTIFYSTHILDDVQRVSDNVAILNHGKLVAQAPIKELLAGTGGAVYAMTVVGDGRDTHARIAAAPWVTSITAPHANGTSGLTTLQVAVTDAQAAETRLLRLALEDPATIVTSFGQKQHNLEEVFMNLVEGGQNIGH
ncbi:MAG TPA: ABC transporter ATP-binding protein [Herpetosiphonaceae bacterium]|nr:ABC transporter ATP-binding protein [Herpetosiphonaceae bacterium]